MASLNRFISHLTDRCRLFYDVLRKNKGFDWSEKHEKSFKHLKIYLISPPLLAKPVPREELKVYLSVTEHAVSGILVKDDKGVQSPV